MVQAILEGRKTQTRRIVKHHLDDRGTRTTSVPFEDWHGKEVVCPYGKVGGIVYVRESWNVEQYPVAPEGDHDELLYFYRATEKVYTDMKWRPSIHMPKEAARLFLKITDIRVERLQDISEEDAKSEGVQENVCESTAGCPSSFCKDSCIGKGEYYRYSKPMNFDLDPCESAVESFHSLWQSINGEDSWKENPWVWVINFERIEKPV